jgi:hypothetical protein
LAGKTKQDATSIVVNFGWQISIIKRMIINNEASYIFLQKKLKVSPVWSCRRMIDAKTK